MMRARGFTLIEVVIAMFIAAAAVVLGGLRSVPSAFAGGLFLGVTQSLVGKYAADWLPFGTQAPTIRMPW